MKTYLRIAAGALLATLAATAGTAAPRLTAAVPAAGAAAKGAQPIVLTFSEKLTPAQSGAVLVMTGMPGMANHPDMKMTGVTATVGRDGRSIVLTSARALPAGTYRIDWHATGADKRRVTGRHVFSVA